ncbi:mersacidin family lantibiotic [Enterococcus rivorum]|uniref:Uncharacterized protein n=1 Tax=Enterococcus rivorum TaxID=762845 RepID=A0A1E5KY84_9ENTE|nr:lichenicidin A2 family type 2 lantibiotic [Enterococcus rivorum]MBP2099633.1 type 2 lantibiotic (TIGR03893 family) [Enterococcus rivorum]OEH82768.1 hypothetical protein BCR26_12060 [Enterococcus rivorum]
MSASFNKELFMELANLIKDDMALYVNTREEMELFINKHPEQYKLLLKKAQAALELSVSGGSFESLSEEEMKALQGSGSVNEGTTVVCLAVEATLGSTKNNL